MDDDLVEPFGIADVFVSGLADVEAVGGGCYRFIFFAITHHEGRAERQVVAKLVAPAAVVPKAALGALGAVGYCLAKGQFCDARLH